MWTSSESYLILSSGLNCGQFQFCVWSRSRLHRRSQRVSKGDKPPNLAHLVIWEAVSQPPKLSWPSMVTCSIFCDVGWLPWLYAQSSVRAAEIQTASFSECNCVCAWIPGCKLAETTGVSSGFNDPLKLGTIVGKSINPYVELHLKWK